jgi:hypothetical protein
VNLAFRPSASHFQYSTMAHRAQQDADGPSLRMIFYVRAGWKSAVAIPYKSVSTRGAREEAVGQVMGLAIEGRIDGLGCDTKAAIFVANGDTGHEESYLSWSLCRTRQVVSSSLCAGARVCLRNLSPLAM